MVVEYTGWLLASAMIIYLFWPHHSREYRIRCELDGEQIPERFSEMSVSQLLDETIDPHRELVGIEKALCEQCGCHYRDHSYTSEVVFHAVRDGHDWSQVMSLASEVVRQQETWSV